MGTCHHRVITGSQLWAVIVVLMCLTANQDRLGIFTAQNRTGCHPSAPRVIAHEERATGCKACGSCLRMRTQCTGSCPSSLSDTCSTRKTGQLRCHSVRSLNNAVCNTQQRQVLVKEVMGLSSECAGAAGHEHCLMLPGQLHLAPDCTAKRLWGQNSCWGKTVVPPGCNSEHFGTWPCDSQPKRRCSCLHFKRASFTGHGTSSPYSYMPACYA